MGAQYLPSTSDAEAAVTSVRRHDALSKLARPAALTMVAVAVAALVADMVVVLTFPAALPSFDATRLSSLASTLPDIPLAFVVTVLVLRRPGNPAGWLLGSFLVLGLVSGLGSDYLLHWLYGHDLPRSLVTPLGLISASASPPSFFPLTILLLVFPDGRPLSKRWKGVVWLNVVFASLAAIPPLFDPTSIGDGHRQLPNPIGVTGAHQLLSGVTDAAELATFVMAAVGLVSLGIRYRRADCDVRQQIKWFGVGMVVLLVAITVGGITSPTSQSWTTPIPVVAEIIGFSALPICIGLAVMKYGLYDIDVFISRTLVYGSLAVFITAVYVGIAVGIGTLVGSGGKPNLALSILATAIVAIGFQPVRERVQRIANRLGVWQAGDAVRGVERVFGTGGRDVCSGRGAAPDGAGASGGNGSGIGHGVAAQDAGAAARSNVSERICGAHLAVPMQQRSAARIWRKPPERLRFAIRANCSAL